MCISGWESEQGLLHGPWSITEMEEEGSLNCFWKKEFLEVGWVSVPDESLLRLPRYYIKSARQKTSESFLLRHLGHGGGNEVNFQIFGLLTGDLASRCPQRVGYGCSSLLPWPGSAGFSAASWQKFLFSQFWKLEVQDQGADRAVSPEASLLSFRCCFLPCLHVIFPPLCLWPYLLFLWGHWSDPDRGLPWYPHFNFITPLKDLVSKSVTFCSSKGWGFHIHFWGIEFNQ